MTRQRPAPATSPRPGPRLPSWACTAITPPKQVTAATTATPVPGTARTHTQVTGLFGGLPLLPPGVVPVSEWRTPAGELAPPCDLYGGVACVPGRWRR